MSLLRSTTMFSWPVLPQSPRFYALLEHAGAVLMSARTALCGRSVNILRGKETVLTSHYASHNPQRQVFGHVVTGDHSAIIFPVLTTWNFACSKATAIMNSVFRSPRQQLRKRHVVVYPCEGRRTNRRSPVLWIGMGPDGRAHRIHGRVSILWTRLEGW